MEAAEARDRWVGEQVKRILVVDDDSQVREILRKRLLKSGYEVLEAWDAEVALDLYRRSPVDVVVTDLVMPGMGGQALIKDLRTEDPDARIVAISGALDHDVPSLLAEAEGLGALETLPKPFTSEQLLGAVDTVLAGPSSPGTAARSPEAARERRQGGLEGWLRSESAFGGITWGGALIVLSLLASVAALAVSLTALLGG
jgi:two-component system cell cycle sensor histidine kinase/response regulator CckA